MAALQPEPLLRWVCPDKAPVVWDKVVSNKVKGSQHSSKPDRSYEV